ncbi:hypothetical protein [Flavobacterium sp.]|uniref:hypothetical protein n=1 Tax=Flavobacterium sp. TaxID=239 RepID=UPI002628EDAD|nr:hypothetical protein [Flavobacterium sp.]MDD2985633.1 hypothetical protein [Flavobacterium sp.]
MKHLIKLFVLVLLLQSFQCEEDNPSTITPEDLNLKKSEIEAYIATFPCEEEIGCNFIAFGSKPCGGPWGYLVFSNAVDLEFLTAEVLEYNEMQHQFNLETGAVSDCAVAVPPTAVGCVDGICGIIE